MHAQSHAKGMQENMQAHIAQPQGKIDESQFGDLVYFLINPDSATV